MPIAVLPDRALLDVSGPEAESFLQNLVTADLDTLKPGEARPAALLTPQGKILFDFLVSRTADGLRLDAAAKARADLAKRLTLYRLRAKVDIAPSEDAVSAGWDVPAPEGAVTDLRFRGEATAFRLYGRLVETDTTAEVYRAHRIAAGIAEAEADFPAADVFPHDVLLNQNGGVSFRKGCFVGQEVVSRMQHRGTARRRVMVLRGQSHLTEGANVEAGERSVGVVLAAAGTIGLAIVRVDKVAAALKGGEALSVDGVPVEAEVPSWAAYTLPADEADDETVQA